MKKLILLCLIIATIVHFSYAQEAVTKLSPKASKGFLYLSTYDGDNLAITYKMPVKKRSKEVLYEQYLFDSKLGFKGANPVSFEKEEKPDRTNGYLRAYVGGNTSFNVLSMKLRVNKEEWEERWNMARQQYEYARRLSSTTVKLKKDIEHYLGHASYSNDNGELIVVVAHDAPNKSEGRMFSLLKVDMNLDVKEIPVTTQPGYSLVYTDVLENGNIYVILAPATGSDYLYAEYTNQGDEVVKNNFQAPSPNTLIFKHAERDGMLYFIGLSRNSHDPYPKVFDDYAPIYSPGYSNAANYQQDKYEKKAFNKEAENFHLLKFDSGKLLYASTTPTNGFAYKLKTPPSQKKGSAYKGRRIEMQEFIVTPSGEFLMAGQLTKRKMLKTSNKSMFGDAQIVNTYLDIVCFHFDAQGNLKAQYAVDKMLNDKKSEIFQIGHNFIASADGKTVYWEMLEVKGTEGYGSFMDAYHGKPSFYAHYFPRIAKINIADASVSNFDVMGGKGKYLLYRNNSLVWDNASRTRYYVGHDKKYKNLFVGKYEMP
jgi:hypothetical protein